MTKLLAEDREDLDTMAALLQDSLVRGCDASLDQKRRMLAFLVNRYRWEESDPQRGHCLIRVHGVTRAQRRSWPDSAAAVLELLHIESDDDMIHFVFAGGTEIRCRVECIDVQMEDVGAPWPVDARPGHDDDEVEELMAELEKAQLGSD